MRLERLQIDRYGPLAGLDEPVASGLQLVHGPNESGKTLLVEGLLELATGRAPKGARVDGEAVGRLELADDDHGPVTVDGDRTMLDVYADRYGYDFTPAEFRNVFVIRDGDLDVEGDYYESVTQQLTGLRSEDIRALQERVRELGRLTDTRLNLSTAGEHGDPGNQRDAAEDLLGAVEAYLEHAREESLDELERELFRARRTVGDLEDEVAALVTAVERDRLADLGETVAELEAALEERAALPAAAAVEDLERGLEALAEREDVEAGLTRRLELYRPVVGLALLLAVLGIAALLLVDLGPLGPLVPAVGVLAAVLAALRYGRTNRRLAAIERDRAQVLRDARGAGLDVDAVDDLRTRVADVAGRRDEADRTVDRAVGALESTLDVDPGDPRDVVDAARERLAERAAALPDADAVDGPVDADSLSDRESELEAARERVAEFEAGLEEHRDELAAIERRAGTLDFERFTGEPLAVEVTSLEALATVRDRLEGFVESIEREAEVARTAHEMLEGMAATEGEKVATLFGPDSRASEVFGLVTGDRYDAVEYDPSADSLVVTGRGDPLAPERLSKGTRDQLFFAVRVGLAEQLLGGQQGFLVLDDAFVAADPDRLDRQVHVLERLADAGWQVLYLTAKADAAERLRERSGAPIELEHR